MTASRPGLSLNAGDNPSLGQDGTDSQLDYESELQEPPPKEQSSREPISDTAHYMTASNPGLSQSDTKPGHATAGIRNESAASPSKTTSTRSRWGTLSCLPLPDPLPSPDRVDLDTIPGQHAVITTSGLSPMP